MEARIHPFEKAGLGTAPFRFIGMEEKIFQACPGAPIQPGSSCDYCGQGIRYVFQVAGADGRAFKVGCDCIRKIAAKGERLLTDAEIAEKRFKREAKRAALIQRIALAMAALAASPALLTDQPHPYEYRAAKGETLRDSVQWLLTHAGDKGQTEACKIIERAA